MTGHTPSGALVERLRVLFAKSTPQPWKAEPADMFGDHNIVRGDSDECLAIAAVVSNMRPADEVAANANLIVETINALPTLLAALDARATPGEGWQDIATAPKDGSRILVIGLPPLWQGYPYVVQWNRKYDGGAGWWQHTDPSLDQLFAVSDSITHWHPLPAPPTPDADHARGEKSHG